MAGIRGEIEKSHDAIEKARQSGDRAAVEKLMAPVREKYVDLRKAIHWQGVSAC